MARPPSTAGGRPHQVTVRFSDDEIAALDTARGSVPRVTYLRGLVPGITVKQRVPRAPDPYDSGPFIPPYLSESVSTCEDPVIEDYVPGPVEVHRHRRGKEISTGFHKGQKITQYACAVKGCTEVLS